MSKDHHYFEGFARKHKMIPQGYVDTPQGRILLADSGEAIIERGRVFYRTGWGIQRNGVDFGNYHDYEIGESGASRSEQKFRLNEATFNARQTLAQLTNSGFYDDGRKVHFAPQPGH